MQVDDNPVDLGHVCFYLVLYDLVRSTMVMYGMVQNNFAWSFITLYNLYVFMLAQLKVMNICLHN